MYLKYICCYDYTYIIVTWLYNDFQYEFRYFGSAKQEGYLGLVSATGRKTAMACRRDEMTKEE